VLHELVDEGEDDGVGGGLDGGGCTGREGEEDTRGEDEEEKSGCQDIPHLFVLVCENLLKLHEAGTVRTIFSRTLLPFNGRRLGGRPGGERRHFKSLLGKYRRSTPLGARDTLVGPRETSDPRAIGLTSRAYTRSSPSLRHQHEANQNHCDKDQWCPLRKLEFHLF
jgi:hypothetical protein